MPHHGYRLVVVSIFPDAGLVTRGGGGLREPRVHSIMMGNRVSDLGGDILRSLLVGSASFLNAARGSFRLAANR